MIDYKYDKIIHHGGGFEKFLIFIVMLCIICCCSCICCSWPADLDTFAGGIFKGFKIPFLSDFFKGFGDVFKGFGDVFKGFGDFGRSLKI
jgi:hypothetical protein